MEGRAESAGGREATGVMEIPADGKGAEIGVEEEEEVEAEVGLSSGSN